MANESLFTKVPIKVQKKSGFDLSFQNLLTTKVGTITPVLCEEVIPNETIDLKAAIQAQLPPLASETFMRCDLKYEAFFVPTRLIMRGYEEWLVPSSKAGMSSVNLKPVIPQITLTPSQMVAGSLADYLGVKSNIPRVPSGTTSGISSDAYIVVNALPFLGYHRIYDDWYRNTLVQKPIYANDATYSSSYNSYTAGHSNYVMPNTGTSYILNTIKPAGNSTAGNGTYEDGVTVWDLRQRNFGIDRFTSATPEAQNGTAQGLSMQVSNSTAGFTIGQLRAANSIQMWLERNNLAGNRLVDYVKANYGANLSDGVAQRALLLGSGSFAVYSKGIYQTQTQQETESVSPNNPFSSVGAQYGSAFASGSDHIIDHFTANEPGYIYVMCTLVPRQNYSTGIDRKFLRYMNNSRTDMANPLLQNTGNEPIWIPELSVDNVFRENGLTGHTQVFGFQEKYADWKSKENEIHGLIREKSVLVPSDDSNVTRQDQLLGSLSSFAAQSSFGVGNTPVLSTNFLQIPQDYLNNVTAVESDLTDYGCWIDSYFDFKVSMPLARNSMPSLQDPAYEHGVDVVLDRGGKRL